jgi:hypothetical protein
MEDTPQHILEDCKIFNEERQNLRNAIQELELDWPKANWEFITKDVYPHFRQFTRSVLQTKKQKRSLTRNDGSTATGKTTRKKSTQIGEQASQLLRRSARQAQ